MPARDAPNRRHRHGGLFLSADLTQPSCRLYSRARRRCLPDGGNSADSNSAEGGITVYTVACNLSDGVQANVFSFEQDAYLFLVDQAQGLTDAQRSELEELAKSQNRTLFWELFNQSVSPVTSYRIESHTLELQGNLF